MGYVRKGYKRKIDLRQATLLYAAGFDFAQIADFFRVTKQAAHACLVKAGVHQIAERDPDRQESASLSDPGYAGMPHGIEERPDGEVAKRTAAYQLKAAAWAEVKNAIARGDLLPSPCEVCGIPIRAPDGWRQVEAHHDDYTKPLEVRWLCRKHHIEWHRKNEAKLD
ncbi:MAG: hypothetical protein K8U57_27475 [Planctomycetes bacterium]|nr:hypothetical protein [Planctomycetota bacterium]